MTSGGTVRSIFNYTRDTGVDPEIYFCGLPHGAEPRRPGDDPREMTVHNGWSRATLFSLDREGFALRDFRSAFQQWGDDRVIRELFYGEAAEVSRAGESHPRALAEPDVRLSPHPAPIVRPRPCKSAQ
jgi:hypothetical protein